MTLNPSADLKALLPQVLAILKQAAQNPDAVDLDMGQAQQVKDALNNLINAKQQQQQGGQQGQRKSKSSSMGPDEGEEDSGEKKSQIIP